MTGASGRLGRLVVARLHAEGRSVRALSRRPPAAGAADAAPSGSSGTQWHVGDVSTGHGLAAAFDGTGTVIHCATDPRGDDEGSARRLVHGASRAGSAHVVFVSIVGVDRIPYSYYRTKRAAELVLESSGLPITVLRATQFHELVVRACAALARLLVLPVPAGTSFQPVAADEVAGALVELSGSPPAGRVPGLAGPEVLTTRQLAATYLGARGRQRPILPVRLPGAAFSGPRREAHLAPDRAVGSTTFAEHCSATSPAPRSDSPAAARGRPAHDRLPGPQPCRRRVHAVAMIERQLVSSGGRWEELVGYSRAVRVGSWVSVSGTTAAAPGGGAVGGTDIEAQAREVLSRIADALEQAGARLEHVVRTRIFVTDIRRWEDVARIHREVFGAIRPATSMVEVRSLIDPTLLVEIEADAVIS